MSIIDRIFGRVGQPAQPAQPAYTPPPTQNNLQAQPNQTTGNYPPVTPGDVGTQQPPKEEFKNLWEPPKEGEGLQLPTVEAIPQDKLLEAAKKFDPTAGIDPAKLQLAMQGGEAGMTALLDVIKQAAQNSYQQGILGAQKLAETQASRHADVAVQLQRIEADRIAVERSLQDKFNNPLVQPFVTQTVKQLQQKHPKASPAELQTLATNALLQAAQVLAPQTQPQAAKPSAAEDWSGYAG